MTKKVKVEYLLSNVIKFLLLVGSSEKYTKHTNSVNRDTFHICDFNYVVIFGSNPSPLHHVPPTPHLKHWQWTSSFSLRSPCIESKVCVVGEVEVEPNQTIAKTVWHSSLYFFVPCMHPYLDYISFKRFLHSAIHTYYYNLYTNILRIYYSAKCAKKNVESWPLFCSTSCEHWECCNPIQIKLFSKNFFLLLLQ